MSEAPDLFTALKNSMRRNQVRDDARGFIVARGPARDDTELVGRLLTELERVDSENRDLSHQINRVREYCAAIPDSRRIADDGYPTVSVSRPDRLRDDILRILGGVS
ncbi:hypothetical protein SEA_FLORAL_62 [Gordonia phage Floral]|nr:hypothetical protein SEA_POLLUX_64 [Gordonia phage Pollux]QAY17664.1 hypothetical protein SEA_EMSQUAREDA_61 [Gordonia phage EMsquaredA]QDP45144.1 hypothetical protein SEA_MARTEENA_60 [Gordonia phage Marteena]QZD97194.1 hypothetical protein SEA_FLORAL_62 [Gordonia phage Floral]